MALSDGYTVPPAERVVARLRRHARRLFWPSLAFVLICGACGYFGFILTGIATMVLWLAGAVLVLIVFVLPLCAWLSTRFTVTTRRIIVRSGFFVRERQEVLHSRGYSVTLRRSWFQAMFRSGTIVIGGADQQAMMVLRDVPHARLVIDALNDLMENSQRTYAPIPQTGSVPFVARSGDQV